VELRGSAALELFLRSWSSPKHALNAKPDLTFIFSIIVLFLCVTFIHILDNKNCNSVPKKITGTVIGCVVQKSYVRRRTRTATATWCKAGIGPNLDPVWHSSASPVELFFRKQLHEQL
jgi:hypothetical protein